MLISLSIQNYAIIDELEISLSDRLNVITGETGAGKSIIAGALDLILGERADTSVLVNKEKKCIVEGCFRAGSKKRIKDFLKRSEMDVQDDLVLRREIATNGKSRAFINDTPVNLSQLQSLGLLLVDLHRQFETLQLGENDFQREVLDALANNAGLLEDYYLAFQKWQDARKLLDNLKFQKQQSDKEADYNNFQYKELDEAGFKENELENIEGELKLLANSEEVKGMLNNLCFELQDSEQPIVQRLKTLFNQLNNFSSSNAGFQSLSSRLQVIQVELQDIAGELEHLKSQVNLDPARIEMLNERLSLGYRLQKKHGVKSTKELLEIHEQLGKKLQEVVDIDESIAKKEKETIQRWEEAGRLAMRISDARNRQVKPFEDKVNKLLVQVGMPNAQLKVEIGKTELQIDGCDTIDFLFDANLPAGKQADPSQFLPLRKVASGGELSRLMLCIKSLVAQSIDLPTMIFDEIDTGISGEAARQVAGLLKELASRRQVICITHQPQIAGKADTHFFVYKEIVNDRVVTNIRKLNTEERITTIARMLSGERPTAAAMANAREMVMN